MEMRLDVIGLVAKFVDLGSWAGQGMMKTMIRSDWGGRLEQAQHNLNSLRYTSTQKIFRTGPTLQANLFSPSTNTSRHTDKKSPVTIYDLYNI